MKLYQHIVQLRYHTKFYLRTKLFTIIDFLENYTARVYVECSVIKISSNKSISISEPLYYYNIAINVQ